MPSPDVFEPNYYQVVNLVVALGMFLTGLAIIVGLVYKKAGPYKYLSMLLAALLVSVASGRVINVLGIDGQIAALADVLAAIIAIATAIVTWLMFHKSLAMPTYEQIERANERMHEVMRKLNEQQLLFNAFLENSPAVAFLEDSQQRFVYVNRAFEQMIGVNRDDVLGESTVLWCPPEEAQVVLEHSRRAIKEKRPIAQMINFPKYPGGPAEPWMVVRFPVPSGDNRAAVGAIAINLAAQQQTQVLDSRLASIVESSQDAIIGQDLDGRITSWNRGAEELYGYTAEEIVGQNMQRLVPADRKNELPEWLNKVRRGIRVHDYETVRQTKRGELKVVSEAVSAVRDAKGIISGAAVIARDITQLKKQQAEILQLNRELKKRVYELAESNAALQAARDQALEASNLKSAFCANISHELRTPLAGILGLNEINLASGKLPEEEYKISQMLQESAESLLNIVNDILDLSKIEAGKILLKYEAFNPAELIHDCFQLMVPTARQKNLSFHLSCEANLPENIYGDIARLRQVLLNLIGNAIKFTTEGSVQVTAKVIQMTSKEALLQFAVHDTGIGIAPDKQRLLFLPFSQVDSGASRRFQGTGLGLTISKRFVEMMGGEISVQSADGQGSTFCVVIPFDRMQLHEPMYFGTEAMVRPAIEPISAELTCGRRVLLVEDNLILQELAIRQLHSLGVEAEAAIFGRQSVDLILADGYDLVLMDINLPDISGLEATAIIRNKERESGRGEIPIIALTAGAMGGDRDRALAAGMNDYLAKPVSVEALKAAIERWLSRTPVRFNPHSQQLGGGEPIDEAKNRRPS